METSIDLSQGRVERSEGFLEPEKGSSTLLIRWEGISRVTRHVWQRTSQKGRIKCTKDTHGLVFIFKLSTMQNYKGVGGCH